MPELTSESLQGFEKSPSHFGATPHADGETTTPESIFDDVESKLKVASSDEDTQTLWIDIRAAFDEGGPSAVKAVIEDRVKRSRLAAEKDLKQVRSVTKSAAPKKKAPAKKAAARKRSDAR